MSKWNEDTIRASIAALIGENPNASWDDLRYFFGHSPPTAHGLFGLLEMIAREKQ